MTETREAMLEAGVRLYGTLAGDLLRGMTAGSVAQEAGFHRQTFYRYWDTQAEFTQDLIRHVLSPPSTPVADGVSVIPESEGGPVDLATFARDVAHHDFARVVDDRRVAMRIGLNVMEALTSPALAALAERYYEASISKLADAYDEALAGMGLEPAPPLTSRDLARMIQGLLLGLVLQAKVARDDPHAGELLERAVAALLEGLTRPVGVSSSAASG